MKDKKLQEVLTEIREIAGMDAGLDAADVAVIPPGYDTVTIGDIERTRLTNIKVMFFAGVNDGIVPKAAGRGGIISQYEREALKELDIELAPGAREQAFIQRFYLYLNMTKPSRELYISYTRLDSEIRAGEIFRPFVCDFGKRISSFGSTEADKL